MVSFRCLSLCVLLPFTLVANASSVLPVFDIEAKVTFRGPTPHLEGTYRVWQKTDFGFATDAPRFYYSSVDPWLDPSYRLTTTPGTWISIPYSEGAVRVQLTSDVTFAPEVPTPAIIHFDLPVTGPLAKTLAANPKQGAVAVMVDAGVDDEDSPYEPVPEIRPESSFAICSLVAAPVVGFDTNNIVPVGVIRGRDRYAIGQSSFDYWLFDFYSSWTVHPLMNSEPQVLENDPNYATPPVPANWLSPNWPPPARDWVDATHTPPGAWHHPNNGRRTVNVQINGPSKYFMVYAPDFSDFQGTRHFQISGIIVRTNS